MKKLIGAVLVLAVCLGCTGCGSAPDGQEAVAATEAVETVTATEVAETEIQETVPALAEPVDQLPRKPRCNFGAWDQENNETDDLEVYDCRMYPTENGDAIFAVDYKAAADLQMIIFGYADDGDDEPNYVQEIEGLTTGEETTFLFEIEKDVLDLIYHPLVLFRNQYGFEVGFIEIFHRNEDIYTTTGNPVGEAEPLICMKEGRITIYDAFMQSLDNGYVRFTLECQPGKDLYMCFYTDPDAAGEQIVCYGSPTSGKKETIVADIWAEDIKGLHNFNFSFYKAGEYPDSRAYMYSATETFDELAPYNFFGFINGAGQFMLVYYGDLDEAVLGATLTAEDGTSIVITEKELSKNGDDCSLVLFKEFKTRKQNTVSLTLSKEGYEDMVLELYVH